MSNVYDNYLMRREPSDYEKYARSVINIAKWSRYTPHHEEAPKHGIYTYGYTQLLFKKTESRGYVVCGVKFFNSLGGYYKLIGEHGADAQTVGHLTQPETASKIEHFQDEPFDLGMAARLALLFVFILLMVFR